ncbi:hypothetical protein SISNIDRAFT_519509 [Sistotremastrum niveocremeum HHB9708]|uniref:F-box domain-containing protein n=1 Tax=Sistotremastrum niveocremeum HHB9708 TaxID=1314777 RepID=A0A164RB58_9AGAM|nr:hypothetical protein SISNIDRAFT_519509 [Sistotremastrum niveocremeum HHB9708]
MPIVEMFFERALKKNIDLSLDQIYQCCENLCKNSTPADQIAQRASFIQSNMSAFQHLTLLPIKLNNIDYWKTLSVALQTPAPNLRSIDIRFSQDMQCPNLFDQNAPKLRTAHLLTKEDWNLDAFKSLTTVSVYIDQDTCQGMISTLESMEGLQGITLIRRDTILHGPLQPLEHPAHAIFTSCRRFEVQKMDSDWVLTLLSAIQLPALTELYIHETANLANLDGETTLPLELILSFSRALTSLHNPHHLPTSISIAIDYRNLKITTNGTPSICYESRFPPHWTYFGPENSLVLDAVSNVCTTLSTIPNVAVRELTILYDMSFVRDDMSTLSSMNAAVLLRRIIAAYPLITRLTLRADVDEAIHVLCAEPHLLPSHTRLEICTLVVPESPRATHLFQNLLHLEALTGCAIDVLPRTSSAPIGRQFPESH